MGSQKHLGGQSRRGKREREKETQIERGRERGQEADLERKSEDLWSDPLFQQQSMESTVLSKLASAPTVFRSLSKTGYYKYEQYGWVEGGVELRRNSGSLDK